jgi:hypothetical protein
MIAGYRKALSGARLLFGLVYACFGMAWLAIQTQCTPGRSSRLLGYYLVGDFFQS